MLQGFQRGAPFPGRFQAIDHSGERLRVIRFDGNHGAKKARGVGVVSAIELLLRLLYRRKGLGEGEETGEKRIETIKKVFILAYSSR